MTTGTRQKSRYFVWFKQKGEGCDYTIGCGERLWELNAKTIEEARVEINGVIEYYCLATDEDCACEHALLLEFREDVIDMVTAAVRAEEDKAAARKLADKRKELEKLKRELGEG